MTKELVRLSYTLAAMLLGTTLLLACGTSANRELSTTRANSSLHTVSVTIPKEQELFTPFILTVQPHTVVTWQNNDTVSHTIMTTWDQSSYLNRQAFSLKAAAGQNVSFTFTKPGVYDYFDNTQARWVDSSHRVKANTGVPNYPLAMEGVIWVQGHINDLPSSATNTVPHGTDEFTTDFLAITQGGRVSWHNRDTDTHFIALVDGWATPINAEDLGPYQVEGTATAPPAGGTTDIPFPTPGLYYYYCSAHADINGTWHRAQARKDASLAPIPMEGFVLVVGN